MSSTPSPVTPGMSARRGWNASLSNLPKFGMKGWGAPSSAPSTPGTELGADEYESGLDEKKEKRRKRKKAEIWVSRPRLSLSPVLRSLPTLSGAGVPRTRC